MKTPLTISNNPAAKFLKQLRPAGPWVLTAIVPDGLASTFTALDTKAVDAFITKHDGKRNLYFSVNPTKRAMTKKAKKDDIKRAEYVHADLDPRDDEKPAVAKRRYLAALENCKPKPTLILDSGNGLQALWKLTKPSQDFAAVEAASLAMTLKLGGAAGTQNVDRILRLPGTINLPTKTKKDKGRVRCPTKLIQNIGTTCQLSDFPKPKPDKVSTSLPATTKLDWAKVEADEGWLTSPDDLPEAAGQKARTIVAWDGANLTTLNEQLGTQYDSDSHVSHALAAVLKQHMSRERAAAALLCDLPCNQHITRQRDQRRAVERSIMRSSDPDEWRRNKNGNIASTMHNARIAIGKLGVECSHDTFHGKLLFGYQGDQTQHALEIGDDVSDHGIIALRQQISDRFGFDPGTNSTRDAVISLANENRFDPVRDMLDKAQREWDGKPRLDAMVATHLHCADTPLNRAFWKSWMLAAVRRVRQPGCKFDLVPVLERPRGGTRVRRCGCWLWAMRTSPMPTY